MDDLIAAFLPPDASQFRFRDLPREIRNMIYKYAVQANGVMDPFVGQKRYKIAVKNSKKLDLSVTLINRQIHWEAKAILFGSNKWQLYRGAGDNKKYTPGFRGQLPPKIDWKVAHAFWTTHAQFFRHVITALDFDYSAGNDVIPTLDYPSIEHLVPEKLRIETSTPPTQMDESIRGFDEYSESEQEGLRYVNLLCEFEASWWWKRQVLAHMFNLVSFTFTLDDCRCRDDCYRWGIIKIVCQQLSILRKYWKTTRVIITGTRDAAERKLVHETWGFYSR